MVNRKISIEMPSVTSDGITSLVMMMIVWIQIITLFIGISNFGVNAYVFETRTPLTCAEAATKCMYFQILSISHNFLLFSVHLPISYLHTDRYEKNVLGLSPTFIPPPMYPQEATCTLVENGNSHYPSFNLKLTSGSPTFISGKPAFLYNPNSNMSIYLSEPITFIKADNLFFNSYNSLVWQFLHVKDLLLAQNFVVTPSDTDNHFYGGACGKIMANPSVNGLSLMLGSVFLSNCSMINGYYDSVVGYGATLNNPPPEMLPSNPAFSLLTNYSGNYSYIGVGFKPAGVPKVIDTSTGLVQELSFLFGSTCTANDECSGNGVCITSNTGCRCFSGYYGPKCNLQMSNLTQAEPQQPSSANSTNGDCILWMRGEDTYADYYSNVISSTITNPLFAPGVMGKSMYFDPSSVKIDERIEIKDFAFPKDEVTVSFWMKSTNEGDHLEKGTPLAYQTDDLSFGFLIDDYRSLKLSVNGSFAFRSALNAATVFDTTVNLNTNSWHHVLVTWSSSTGVLKLYLNGTLTQFATNYKKNVSIQPKGYLTIAHQRVFTIQKNITFASNNRFRGYLDELAIFERVLSPTEISILAEPGIFCFGKSSNDPNVCNGRGSCMSFNKCSCSATSNGTQCETCKPGYVGDKCQYVTCAGIPSYNSSVCLGRGDCVGIDTCACTYTFKFSGPNCENFTCNDGQGCQNGVCTVNVGNEKQPVDNICKCNTGYYSENNRCLTNKCNGKFAADPNACSGKGTCVGLNVCNCQTGYLGDDCQYSYCIGIPSNDTKVCHSRGTCTDQRCSCKFSWTTDDETTCSCLNYKTEETCLGTVPKASEALIATNPQPDQYFVLVPPQNPKIQVTMKDVPSVGNIAMDTFKRNLYCYLTFNSQVTTFAAATILSQQDRPWWNFEFNIECPLTIPNGQTNGTLTVRYRDIYTPDNGYVIAQLPQTVVVKNFALTAYKSNVIISGDPKIYISYNVPLPINSNIYLFSSSGSVALTRTLETINLYEGNAYYSLTMSPATYLSNTFGSTRVQYMDYSLSFLLLNQNTMTSYSYPSSIIESASGGRPVSFVILVQGPLTSVTSDYNCVLKGNLGATTNVGVIGIQTNSTSSIVTCASTLLTVVDRYSVSVVYIGKSQSAVNSNYAVGTSLTMDIVSVQTITSEPVFVTSDLSIVKFRFSTSTPYTGPQYSYVCISSNNTISNAVLSGSNIECNVAVPHENATTSTSLSISVKHNLYMSQYVSLFTAPYIYLNKQDISSTVPAVLQWNLGKVTATLKVLFTVNKDLKQQNYYCQVDGNNFQGTVTGNAVRCNIDYTLSSPSFDSNGIYYTSLTIAADNGQGIIPVSNSFSIPIAGNSITIHPLHTSRFLYSENQAQNFTLQNFKLNKAKFNCSNLSIQLNNYEGSKSVAIFPAIILSDCSVIFMYNPNTVSFSNEYFPANIVPKIEFIYSDSEKSELLVSTNYYFVNKYLRISESFPYVIDYSITQTLNSILLKVIADGKINTNFEYKCIVGTNEYPVTILTSDVFRCDVISTAFGVSSPSTLNVYLNVSREKVSNDNIMVQTTRNNFLISFTTTKFSPNYLNIAENSPLFFSYSNSTPMIDTGSYFTNNYQVELYSPALSVTVPCQKTPSKQILCNVTSNLLPITTSVQSFTPTMKSTIPIDGTNYNTILTTMSQKVISYKIQTIQKTYPKAFISNSISPFYIQVQTSYDPTLSIQWDCFAQYDQANPNIRWSATFLQNGILVCHVNSTILNKAVSGIVNLGVYFSVNSFTMDNQPLQFSTFSPSIYSLTTGTTKIVSNDTILTVGSSFSLNITHSQTIPTELITSGLAVCVLGNTVVGSVYGTLTSMGMNKYTCAFATTSKTYGLLTLTVGYYETFATLSKVFEFSLSNNTDQWITTIPLVSIQSVSQSLVQTGRPFSLTVMTSFNTTASFGVPTSYVCIWENSTGSTREVAALIIKEGIFNCSLTETISGLYKLSIGIILNFKPSSRITNAPVAVSVIGGSFFTPSYGLIGGDTISLLADFANTPTINAYVIGDDSAVFTCSLVSDQKYSCMTPNLLTNPNSYKTFYPYPVKVNNNRMTVSYIPYMQVNVTSVFPPFVLEGKSSEVTTTFSAPLTLYTNTSFVLEFFDGFNTKIETTLGFSQVQSTSEIKVSSYFGKAANYIISASTNHLVDGYPVLINIVSNGGLFQVLQPFDVQLSSSQSDILLINVMNELLLDVNYRSLTPTDAVKQNLYCDMGGQITKAQISNNVNGVDKLKCNVTSTSIGSNSVKIIYSKDGYVETLSSLISIYFEKNYVPLNVTPFVSLTSPVDVAVVLNGNPFVTTDLLFVCASDVASALAASEAIVSGSNIQCRSLHGNTKTAFDVYVMSRLRTIPYKLTSTPFNIYFQTVQSIYFINPFVTTLSANSLTLPTIQVSIPDIQILETGKVVCLAYFGSNLQQAVLLNQITQGTVNCPFTQQITNSIGSKGSVDISLGVFDDFSKSYILITNKKKLTYVSAPIVISNWNSADISTSNFNGKSFQLNFDTSASNLNYNVKINKDSGYLDLGSSVGGGILSFVAPFIVSKENYSSSSPSNYIAEPSIPVRKTMLLDVINTDMPASNPSRVSQISITSLVVYDFVQVDKISPYALTISDIVTRGSGFSKAIVSFSKYSIDSNFSPITCKVWNGASSFSVAINPISSMSVECSLQQITGTPGKYNIQLEYNSNSITLAKSITILQTGLSLSSSNTIGSPLGGTNISLPFSIDYPTNQTWSSYSYSMSFLYQNNLIPFSSCSNSVTNMIRCMTPKMDLGYLKSLQLPVVVLIDNMPSMTLNPQLSILRQPLVSYISPSFIDLQKVYTAGDRMTFTFDSKVDYRFKPAVRYRTISNPQLVTNDIWTCYKNSEKSISCPMPSIVINSNGFILVDISFDSFQSFYTHSSTIEMSTVSSLSIYQVSPQLVEILTPTIVSITLSNAPRNVQPKVKLFDDMMSVIYDATFSDISNQITFSTKQISHPTRSLSFKLSLAISIDNGYSFISKGDFINFYSSVVSVYPKQGIAGQFVNITLSGVPESTLSSQLGLKLRLNGVEYSTTPCSIYSNQYFCLTLPTIAGSYHVILYRRDTFEELRGFGNLMYNIVDPPLYRGLYPSLVFSFTSKISIQGTFSLGFDKNQVFAKMVVKNVMRSILQGETQAPLSVIAVGPSSIDLAPTLASNALPSGVYNLMLSIDSGMTFTNVQTMNYTSALSIKRIRNATPDFALDGQILTIVPNNLYISFDNDLPCYASSSLKFQITSSSSISSISMSLDSIYAKTSLTGSSVFECSGTEMYILFPALNETLSQYSLLGFPFTVSFGITFNDIDVYSTSVILKNKYDEPRLVSVYPSIIERNLPTTVVITGENLAAAVGCQFNLPDSTIVRVPKIPSSVIYEFSCQVSAQIANFTRFTVQLYTSKQELSNTYYMYTHEKLKILSVSPKQSWTYENILVTLAVEGIDLSLKNVQDVRAMFGSFLTSEPCSVESSTSITCKSPKREKGFTSISISYNRRDWYSLNGEIYNPSTLSAAAKSMFEFVACPAGYGSPSFREPCLECKPGFYKPNNGSNDCIKCAQSSYSTSYRATECIQCPVNSFTLAESANSLELCICKSGYYLNPKPKSDLSDYCLPCDPTSMICNPGSKHPLPKYGYWIGTHDNFTVYSCVPAEACGGYSINNCTAGYISGKCGACDIGYYKFNGFCSKCGSDAIWRLLGFGLVMIVVVLAFLLISSIKVAHLASISIALSFFQVVAMFTKYQIKWPVAMEYSFTASSATIFNSDFINPKCIFAEMSHVTKWYIVTLFPFYILILFIVLFILGVIRNAIVNRYGHLVKYEYWEPYRYHDDLNEAEFLMQKEKEKHETMKQKIIRLIKEQVYDWKIWIKNLYVWLRNLLVWMCKEKMTPRQMKIFFNQLINGFTAFLSFTFAFIISQASDIFYCISQPDHTCALVASPDINIGDPQWYAMLPLSILYFLIFGLGALVFFLGLYIYKKQLKLQIRRDLLIHNPDLSKQELKKMKWKAKNPVLLERVKDFDLRFKYIQMRFKKRLFYWEIIITCRKLLLSIFNTFLLPLQTVTFALITVFVAFLLHSQYVPFKTKFHNLLEWVSLVCTELVLFFGLLFLVDNNVWLGNSSLRSFCEWIASIVIVTSIVIVLGMLIYDIYVRRKKDRKKERQARLELEKKYGKENAKKLQQLYNKLFGNAMTNMTKVILLDEDEQEKWHIIENPLCEHNDEFEDDEWEVVENELFIPDDQAAYARMKTAKRKVEFNLTLFESDHESSDEDECHTIRDIMEGLVNLKRIRKKVRLAKAKGRK
ncbi:hypothetical protein C9374_002243 [Naegleria lovaniensis]|uniref:Uncharacterized protein n=1 Tax=Naegleria lovaniensis TaxID=51637 RepID=A0AA88KM27_NAELO|nr:uncharacterized protein C9374_002243 [Naegleria lovaniensis]KAG2386499.1 hypothetical protein C9374_002243 [Naegleria lovaniensis]